MTLRAVLPSDSETIRGWRNQPDVAAHMYTDHHITREEHVRWFERALSDPSRRYWIITQGALDVGLAGLYDISREHGRCHAALYVARAGLRGRGAGALAEHGLIIQAFEVMGLSKICCEVLEHNLASIKGHETFGFAQEGRLRRHIVKQGRHLDVVLMGLLRDDWERRRGGIEPRIQRILDRRERHASGEPRREENALA